MDSLQRKSVTYKVGDSIPPWNAYKQTVEDFARSVAEHFGFNPGDDLIEFVENKLEGRIHYEDIEDWASVDGSIFVHEEYDFDILLSTYTSPLRDNFTIAHELGHFFIHSEQGAVPIIAHRKGSTRIEWEANWFAASLLMPADEFKKMWRRKKDIVTLAQHFGVSVDAAEVRRQSLYP